MHLILVAINQSKLLCLAKWIFQIMKKDNLYNEYGVYENYETILIGEGYREYVEIMIAETSENLFRFGLSIQVNFQGSSYAPNVKFGVTHKSRQVAISAATKEALGESWLSKKLIDGLKDLEEKENQMSLF